MATKQRFRFKLEDGWETQYMNAAIAKEGPMNDPAAAKIDPVHIEIIRANMIPALVEDLTAQLSKKYSDRSSPEYQKYQKYIPTVALLFSEEFTLQFVVHEMHAKKCIAIDKPIDEHFDILGCKWVLHEQFEEALSAFTKSVENSKREGCWWQKRLCVRYNHLAFAHMALGNELEQLRASMYGAAFAVAAKNSASDSTACTAFDFKFSFLNLDTQFVGFNPNFDFKNQVIDTFIQGWEKNVGERWHSLQEKLDSGKEDVVSETDLWFALADFLIHSNRDSLKTMSNILKSSLSESLSAPSKLVESCDLATGEFKLLMKVCQMYILNMTMDTQQAAKLRTNLNFVLELLEVASTLDASSDQCEGWSNLSEPVVSWYIDERGIPWPFPLFDVPDSTPIDSVSDHWDFGAQKAEGIATPIIAEGSNYEQFMAIKKRLESKEWEFGTDPSELQEFANIIRDLGLWATSPSTAAESPVHNIQIALNTVLHTVRKFRDHPDVVKSMLKDVVLQLIDQCNDDTKELSMFILEEYSQNCDEIRDFEERVNCCKKALSLAEKHKMHSFKLPFHFWLGFTYVSCRNVVQAKKELKLARDIMESDPNLVEGWETLITGAEGRLEFLECQNARGSNSEAEKHRKIAVKKLTTTLQKLEEIQPLIGTYSFQLNFMTISMSLYDALRFAGNFTEAQAVCLRAFEEVQKLFLKKEYKSSKRLKLTAVDVAAMCGYQAQIMGNFVSAEQFYREGLQELQELSEHGYVNECMIGALHGGLGRTFLNQGKLPEAEDALRKAVDACSRCVMDMKIITSYTRIQAFNLLQYWYNDLQLCFYATYIQAAECERGKISVEALVAAERGRCRDLTFNLEEDLRSRIAGDDKVLTDPVSVDQMDWRKFDTDTDYAWGHLKSCMAKCTDVIKEQNPEVQRVAFVEYTLTNRHMLVWIFHSHGTQEPSALHETTQTPFMHAVEVKGKLLSSIDYQKVFEKNCEWVYGPQKWDSHRDHMVQYAQASEAVVIFEETIEKLRKDYEPGTRKLNELYDLLITPIADKLAIGEPVIFIPHAELSFVPFAALKPKAPKAKERGQKGPGQKYFIEDHPVGYASSLRTLGWATNQFTALKANSTMSARNPMLLVADPFPLGVDKEGLEDATKEVSEIAEMLPPGSTATLKKEQATLENVTSAMKTASWFHIACHGEVNLELYPQGVLFLSCNGESSSQVGNHDDDSIVHDNVHSLSGHDVDAKCKAECTLPRHCKFTPEILSGDVGSMTAQAAVLSACKVGLGEKSGEGLLGFSRAFMQAGVPLVIAPLRTLDSELGSAFMQAMYRRLVTGESVMFALQNTMVDVIKKRIVMPHVEKIDDDDEEDEVKWKLWDWAAWVAVGFPGVCLPLLDSQLAESSIQELHIKA